MEMLSPDAEGSATAGSVKSEDSTPPHEGGRGSPPPNCAICLGTCRNKCFTDSCLHQFCFKCLLTWSKVKAECPLCKQNFKSIIHNVRSNHQYEEYMVEQRVEPLPDPAVDLSNATRRFRYRTTLTLPRRDTLALQHLLLHYPMMAGVLPPAGPGAAGAGAGQGGAGPAPAPGPGPRRRRRSPNSFRRTVYRHNLWARPLPDFTGRYRDCSPEFYRRNDSQMHRLVPWLSRELHYLLNENAGHVAYVLARLLELLPRHHVTSAEFAAAARRYFGERTEHFLHELHCFASTPYDMAGYDRQVQYTTDARISTVVNEISSADSDSDSDIVVVSASAPPEAPGPSRVVPIEAVSRSASDSDGEVVVVGYIKPPAQRTPEVVDLLGSDSDVVVHEPAPAPRPEPERGLVKLSLTRRRAAGDSDSSYAPEPEPEPEPEPRARRRRVSSGSSSSRLTPSPPPPKREPLPPPPPPPGPSSTDSESEGRRRRNPKRARRKSSRRDKKRSRRSPSRRHSRRRDTETEGERAGPSTSRAARLRSVVRVPARAGGAGSGAPGSLLQLLSRAILDPRSDVLAYGGAEPSPSPAAAEARFRPASSGSDPEDDLPLNLSVRRSRPL